jgi:hypothetical protein
VNFEDNGTPIVLRNLLTPSSFLAELAILSFVIMICHSTDFLAQHERRAMNVHTLGCTFQYTDSLSLNSYIRINELGTKVSLILQVIGSGVCSTYQD